MPKHISTEEEELLGYVFSLEHLEEHWDINEFDLANKDDLRLWSYDHGHYPTWAQDFFDQSFVYPNMGLIRVYQDVWVATCELLFALRRRWNPHDDLPHGNGELIKTFYDFYSGGHPESRYPEGYYLYYDDEGGLDYRWALYTRITDPELITGPVGIFEGREIMRTDQYLIHPITGQNISQDGTAGPGPESDSNPQKFIPPFPHWDDKIVEKFHRSTDPEMDEYNKSLDNWSALMSNVINQIA